MSFFIGIQPNDHSVGIKQAVYQNPKWERIKPILSTFLATSEKKEQLPDKF